MKKQASETDYIGGEGPLTKEEELALAQYFSKKKSKNDKRSSPKLTKTKQTPASFLRP